MTTTAITVTYRTGPRLRDCLYALKADPDIDEILIVDNGNAPAEAAFIKRFLADTPKARQIETGRNIGFGAAANIGARDARGEYILFINPDAAIRWNSVSPLIEAARGRPAPVIVGGKIFGLDGKEQRGGRRNTLTLLRAYRLSKWTLENDPAPEGPVPVGAISGGFFLTPRADFLSLGGFDENFFLHVEDVDLCRRALDAGGSVIYQPAAAALHYGQTSDAPSLFVEAHKAAGLKRYFLKHAKGPISRASAHVFGSLLAQFIVTRAMRSS